MNLNKIKTKVGAPCWFNSNVIHNRSLIIWLNFHLVSLHYSVDFYLRAVGLLCHNQSVAKSRNKQIWNFLSLQINSHLTVQLLQSHPYLLPFLWPFFMHLDIFLPLAKDDDITICHSNSTNALRFEDSSVYITLGVCLHRCLEMCPFVWPDNKSITWVLTARLLSIQQNSRHWAFVLLKNLCGWWFWCQEMLDSVSHTFQALKLRDIWTECGQ